MRSRYGDGGLGLHALADQRLDPRPEMGIAFALHVTGSEGAVEPGSSFTLDGRLPVIVAIVAENLGAGGVGGNNLRAAVNKAVRLIEVYGGSDIVGDGAVFLPELGDAINLDREQDGNSTAIQLTSKQDNGRGAPAVAVKNDVSLRFFGVGKSAVVIAIEQVKDGLIRQLSMTVLENANVGAFRSGALDALRDLDCPVVRVIVTNKAAHKADDDVGGLRLHSADRAIRCPEERSSRCGQDECREKRTKSRRARHAGS